MAIYELAHPLGQDIEKIHGAFLAGFAEHEDLLSEKSIIRFTDALDSGTGISTLRIASLATKNRTKIEVPVAIEKGDPAWMAGSEVGFEPVLQRVTVKRMLGTGFEIKVGEDEYIDTPYLRFDIVSDGIILLFEAEGDLVPCFGEYDSQKYGIYTESARFQASIGELAILAEVI